MDQTNPYIILNVPYSASNADIKSAYKKKALQYHPDKISGDAEKFLIIKKAYDDLNDTRKRKKIDAKILEEENFINLKNNTFSTTLLINIIDQIESQINSASKGHINKELLGKYLLWLFDKKRIYIVLNNSSKIELDHIIQKTVLLIDKVPNNLQLEFYIHIKLLNAQFGIQLLQDDKIQEKLNKISLLSTYNKYKVILLIMTSIFFCFIIYFTSK